MAAQIQMTVRQLINRSARLSTRLGEGENLSSSEAEDALMTLNEIVDKWNAEKMMLAGYEINELPLSGKEYYTIGIGGDVDIVKPQYAFESIYYQDANNKSFPMRQILLDEYTNIQDKYDTIGRSNTYYFENDNYLAKLYVLPITSQGKLVMRTDKVFDMFDSLDTIISFPPAYMRALRYALAVDLSREYGIPENLNINATAYDAKMLIKVANEATKDRSMSLDLPGMSRRGFNIYTGE